MDKYTPTKQDPRPYILLFGLIILMSIGLYFLYLKGVENRKQWESYAEMHNCKIAGSKQGTVEIEPTVNIDGSIGYGIGGDSAQVLYKCDDGTEHWRNR